MRRVLLLASGLAALGSLSTAALAEPYWVAYEGNDYPENEGWWRLWYDGKAIRSLEDGVLVQDTLFDPHIADFYVMHRWGSLDPEPGETFVVQWRVQIDERSGEDVTIGLFSDEQWGVGFIYSNNMVYSAFEDGKIAVFEPGAYHDFEFRSSNMRDYQLTIDGQIAFEGAFWLSLIDSEVSWGDGSTGAASLSRWDYFRFGVIPEPTTGLSMFLTLFIGFQTRRQIRNV
jgi:hypothetical protein